jgi:hypothetical protein
MNENKTQKMRDDGRDEYDIKKQEEILQESYMMIPHRYSLSLTYLLTHLTTYSLTHSLTHSKKQLEEAVEELTALVNECKEGGETIDAAMLEEANTILTSAN